MTVLHENVVFLKITLIFIFFKVNNTGNYYFVNELITIFLMNTNRTIQEDFDNLYGKRHYIPLQQQPPTDVEEWTVRFGFPEHEKHGDDLLLSQGDFLQEFEQMFQKFFRGFPFDFNHSIQGFWNFFCSFVYWLNVK